MRPSSASAARTAFFFLRRAAGALGCFLRRRGLGQRLVGAADARFGVFVARGLDRRRGDGTLLGLDRGQARAQLLDALRQIVDRPSQGAALGLGGRNALGRTRDRAVALLDLGALRIQEV